MNDPRIEIPDSLRNFGIFGGLLAIVLGLLIGWRRSGMDAILPPTGGPVLAPVKSTGILDVIAALRGDKKD